MPGSIVPRTGFSRNLNSRYLLGVASGSGDLVSPGGTCARVRHQSFGQQGREQLAVQPGLRALARALREVAKLCDRLEPLEGQFHLPPETVPVEDRLRGEPGFGEGGEDDHVFHELQRLRLRSPAVLGRLPAKRLQGDPDRRVGRPDRADPSVDGDRIQQVEPTTVRQVETEGAGVDPHQDMAAGFRHVPDAGGRRVATVPDQVVADQRGKAHAVVNPPERPRLSRLLDGRRVDRPDFQAGAVRRRSSPLEQRLTQGQEPGSGLRETRLQRHRRQVGEPRTAGTDGGLA